MQTLLSVGCDQLSAGFQYGVAQKPKSYWKNTSDNAIIRSFIDYAGDNITTKLETLMAGGSIVQHIEENLTYDYLHSSEENLLECAVSDRLSDQGAG